MTDIAAGRMSHAWLVASPSAEARRDQIQSLAATLLCGAGTSGACGVCRDCRKVRDGIHPDLITLEREVDDKGKKKRYIQVDQIRGLIADAYILPNEARRKVYVILEAETMNGEAQNALLKLLEEPPAHVAILLSAENAGRLFDTVRSRCVELTVNAPGATSQEEGIQQGVERYLQAVSTGNPAAVLQACTALEKLAPDQLAELLESLRRTLADMLCLRRPDMGMSREQLLRLTRLQERAGEYLRLNVSVKHILGLLAVKF